MCALCFHKIYCKSLKIHFFTHLNQTYYTKKTPYNEISNQDQTS